MGAETVRVKGDVKIPDGETVRFGLIVFGDLTSGENVKFLDGLHVEGTLRLGDFNSVKGSVHCEGNMMIGRQTTIEEAVYSLGILLVGKGARIGIGENGGGVVCDSEAYVEQEFTVREKLLAEKIITVEKLSEELMSRLDKERPKPKHRKESSAIRTGVQERTDSRKVDWQKTEHKGTISPG